MSEDKFTPGPWKADESYCLGAVNAGKRHIAMVNLFDWRDDKTRVTREQQIANSHLIAAAPDMYAALKMAEEFIVNGVECGYIRLPDADCHDPAHGTLPAISLALAKARGE